MTANNRKFIGRDPKGGLGTAPFSRRQLLIGATGVGAAAALAACTPGASPQGSGTSTGTPKPGGNFRLGLTGGGAKDIIDGQKLNTNPDAARLRSTFETLLSRDDGFRLASDGLAESVEADGPLSYTIRLKKGVEFHNGKTMTADDVIYSLRRPGSDVKLAGNQATASMDLANIQKMDQYTVRLPMKTPDSTIPDELASYYFSVVPDGYQAFSGDPSTQVGTGPYALKSFTPGERSVSERHPNYWREGQPYFDSVTIIDFADITGTVNALRGGQIDAMMDLPAAQVAGLQSQGLKVLQTQTGHWAPFCMAIDKPPFDDDRVREAFRLIVDRPAMLKQVASGYGEIGNDLYGRYNESYFTELPQRERDIDKAKALLKAAGKEGLTIDLFTTNISAGQVEMATVFAQQAKDAGVTVNVKNTPSDTYYGEDFLNYAFSTDFWNPRGYLQQVKYSMLPTSQANETHWPPKSGRGATYEALFNQALAATDPAKRIEIEHEMQQLEYDLGGYIIPYFPAKLDAYAANVQGLSADAKTTFSLNDFGHGFRTMWFA